MVLGCCRSTLQRQRTFLDWPIDAAEWESIKWHLWHGNVYATLQRLDFLAFDLDCYEGEDPVVARLQQIVHEFHHYIDVNRSYIPNYGERYRYGETISTAFVESSLQLQVIWMA